MSAIQPAGGPAIIAHRGASRARPENTLAAFAHAKELGADGVELDVRTSADGALVVHHDARLADGRALITTVAAELPPAVPTLAAALDTCRGIMVNVEVKSSSRDPDHVAMPDTVAAVGDELRSHVAEGGHDTSDLLVTSFDPEAVALMRRLAPELPVGQLVLDAMKLSPLMEEVVALGGVAINPWDPLVDGAFVADAHRLGLAVNVWTVDDPGRIRQLAAEGVDGIITNVPDLAREALDSTD
jgi:glycerophosphoryl diester phosphodiesterase